MIQLVIYTDDRIIIFKLGQPFIETIKYCHQIEVLFVATVYMEGLFLSVKLLRHDNP